MNIVNKINLYLFDNNQQELQSYDNGQVWVQWRSDCPFIFDAVLDIPDLSTIVNIFLGRHVKDMSKKCDDVFDFIKLLNITFEKSNIEFQYKPIKSRDVDAKTIQKSGKIIIYVEDSFLFNYINNLKKLKNTLLPRLSHELVHREQMKKINWSKYHHKVSSIKGNIGNKMEIMAYSKTIVDKLLLKLNYNKKNSLKWLQSPDDKVNIREFDNYVSIFGQNSKEVKQLYKYMYQYLIIERENKNLYEDDTFIDF